MDTQPTTTMSPSIASLAAALAKAQGEFAPIIKNRTVEVQPKKRDDGSWPAKYTFNYATLDSVLDATRSALAANGLCHTSMLSEGKLYVNLYHSSGEWLSSSVPAPMANQGWQSFGSAVTYLRRYLLTPLLGVASEEDDDGNAAEGNHVGNMSNGQAQAKPNTQSSARNDAPKDAAKKPAPLKDLIATLKKLGKEKPADVLGWMTSQLKKEVKATKDLTEAEIAKLTESANAILKETT
jgi:hypothetical protein